MVMMKEWLREIPAKIVSKSKSKFRRGWIGSWDVAKKLRYRRWGGAVAACYRSERRRLAMRFITVEHYFLPEKSKGSISRPTVKIEWFCAFSVRGDCSNTFAKSSHQQVLLHFPTVSLAYSGRYRDLCRTPWDRHTFVGCSAGRRRISLQMIASPDNRNSAKAI